MIKALLITLLTATLAHAQGYDARTADYVRAWRIGAGNQIDPIWNGLVAYWSMDSRSTNDVTVFDTWGSNDGTAFESPLFGSDYGKRIDGVRLNGSNQYIDTGNPFSQSNTTVSLWVRTSNWNQGTRAIASISSNPVQDSQFGLLMHAGSSRLDYIVGGAFIQLAYSAIGFATDRFYHFTFTAASGDKVRLYIDGEEVNSANIGTITPNNTQNVWIGRYRRFTQYFSGDIDEVAIWNRVLSTDEITGLHNNGAGRFFTP